MKSNKETLNSINFTSVQDAYLHLENALKDINTNEHWLQYLSFQSKFYDYSFSNVLLIYLQNPSASYVAGYKTWQNLKRHVKKGERAIKILAPCKYKVQNEENEDNQYKIYGFKYASVFDVFQTYGNDEYLPPLVSGLRGSFQGEEEIYKKLIDIVDIPINETDQLSSKGCYYLENPRIEINSTLSTIQKIKTLCHEYSHHLHHIRYFEQENYDLSEIIVESSAFIVSSYLGIDSSSYSFPYIKSWSNDIKDIQVAASKSQKISSDIINLINKPLVFPADNKAV